MLYLIEQLTPTFKLDKSIIIKTWDSGVYIAPASLATISKLSADASFASEDDDLINKEVFESFGEIKDCVIIDIGNVLCIS